MNACVLEQRPFQPSSPLPPVLPVSVPCIARGRYSNVALKSFRKPVKMIKSLKFYITLMFLKHLIQQTI